MRQIGRELGVRYVLEGSVRRGGDRIRISAQLIDAGTGGHRAAASGSTAAPRSAQSARVARPVFSLITAKIEASPWLAHACRVKMELV